MKRQNLRAKDIERLENISSVFPAAEIGPADCGPSCGETCHCFPSYACCQTVCLGSGQCTAICSMGPSEVNINRPT